MQINLHQHFGDIFREFIQQSVMRMMRRRKKDQVKLIRLGLFIKFTIQNIQAEFNYVFLKFTQQGFRKKLLRWIVIDNQPFTVVEKQEFNEMMLYLCPEVNIPSADTLRRDLSANFEQMKEQVHKLQVSNF